MNTITRKHIRLLFFTMLLPLLHACRHDIVIWPSEEEETGGGRTDAIQGFYLLNEGNMGSNKCTMDYYDYASGLYVRNIYGNANPMAVKELGDVGNDLQIYGSRMWAVVNCSNKVEVMEAATARRIGQVDLSNCRYICFHDGYAYVSSYAGPVQIKPDYEQRGIVVKIDTATLEKVDTCIAGFQPDCLAILEGKLYVANSGGYMSPNYENTISVIDLDSFTEERRLPVAVNLHHVLADRHGQLWVSSRGDYYGNSNSLFCVTDPAGEAHVQRITAPDGRDIVAKNMTICGDSLYVIGKDFSYVTMDTQVNYAIVNTVSHEVVTTNFIADGTEASIMEPYGLAVNPVTREVLLGDARSYVNPGTLLCYSAEGMQLWKVRTGDIPAHMAFLWK
ncbi:MAG: YncE family protein [Bacteroides sp.]|nr:YncE family protein [Bacteroides sp.]MCM1447911.1 YncE family protein [Bacteroides sp.]